MSFAPERPIGCDLGQRQKRFSPAAARHGGSAAGPTPALKGPASARVSGAKWGDVINWRLSFEASAEGLAEHPWQSWVSAACAELPRPPSTHSQPRPTALSPPASRAVHHQPPKPTRSFHFNALFSRASSRPSVSNTTFAAGTRLPGGVWSPCRSSHRPPSVSTARKRPCHSHQLLPCLRGCRHPSSYRKDHAAFPSPGQENPSPLCACYREATGPGTPLVLHQPVKGPEGFAQRQFTG